jgi:hypothetical protein
MRDPRFFCRWLREFFEVDERRLRVTLYLHQGLDLVGSGPVLVAGHRRPAVAQFGKPYRAVPDADDPAQQARPIPGAHT